MNNTRTYNLTESQRKFLIKFNDLFKHTWNANVDSVLREGVYNTFQRELFNRFTNEYTENIDNIIESRKTRPHNKWNVYINAPEEI